MAPEMGWAGKRNSDLLRLAEHSFDVLLTVDQYLPFQQNLSVFDVAIIVLIAPSNTITDLRPLMPEVVANLTSAKRGEPLLIR